ncbi:hypothetical protein B0H14DRAFT_3640701 [Mycena olivaceomarginata]|nr:hypothetical protein B0H14DRAFT_3640701 [Mycena olivaceomarginata]
MAQSSGHREEPREKSLDPGEQFDLETDLAGEEEELLRSKGKNKARADSLSSLSDKDDGDGVMLDNLEGARPRICICGSKLPEECMGDSSPSKEAQGATNRYNRYKSTRIQDLECKRKKEEEDRRKEKTVAKKKKKKEQGASAAKSQGGQPAATEAGPAPIPKRPTATTPGAVTPNAKQVKKSLQTPEQTETLEVSSPAEADEALVAAEASKRPTKRARGRKVSFSNPVASTSATTDTPPGEEESICAQVFSPTTMGLQGLRVERNELGRFVMPPERLLEIIQSAAAELAASQAAEAMKMLTESGANHEVVNTAIPLHIETNIKGGWKRPFPMTDLTPAACVSTNKARDKKEDRQLIQRDGKFVLAEGERDDLSGDKLMTATDFMLASKNLIEAVKRWYTPESLRKAAAKNLKKHFKVLFDRDEFRRPKKFPRIAMYNTEVLLAFVVCDPAKPLRRLDVATGYLERRRLRRPFEQGALLPNSSNRRDNSSSNKYGQVANADRARGRTRAKAAKAATTAFNAWPAADAVTHTLDAEARARGSSNHKAADSGKRQRGTSSVASRSTPVDVRTPDETVPVPVTSHIAAPSAAQDRAQLDARLQAILRSSARRAEIFPIVTTLKADAWARRIEQAGTPPPLPTYKILIPSSP